MIDIRLASLLKKIKKKEKKLKHILIEARFNKKEKKEMKNS